MSTQSNTLSSNQKELGLLVWLSLNKKWAYKESAVSTYEEKSITDDNTLKSAAFNMSSKTLQNFLEQEEDSIF